PPPAGPPSRGRRVAALSVAVGAFTAVGVAWAVTQPPTAEPGDTRTAEEPVEAASSGEAVETPPAPDPDPSLPDEPEATNADPPVPPTETEKVASGSEADPAPEKKRDQDRTERHEPSHEQRTERREPSRDQPSQRAMGGEPGTRRGTLLVSVVPHGNVWIDGRKHGAAPVRMRVRPGAHTVATGEKAPEKFTSVEVEAGKLERVVLHAQ
ncbi:MAG: hypothetical protein ACODAG_09955, partial [Myxococcota bacterium]